MNNAPYAVVEITLKRIQSFLFAVPRLKAMIGANVLLGETVRKSLVDEAKKNGSINLLDGDISQDVTFDTTDDPLNRVVFDENDDHLKDHPLSLYKQGVISRDGGHFTAAFSAKTDVDNFINKVREIIAEQLPGVQIEIEIKTFEGKEEEEKNEGKISMSWGDSPARLPQFQICQDTGADLANKKRNNKTPPLISNRVRYLEITADRFRKGNTYDIVGLLRRQLPTLDSSHRIPKDLEQLAGKSGYIAVIHADGNNMGVRRKIWAGTADSSADENNFAQYFAKEIKNERFFHSMRTAVRASVLAALDKTFSKEELAKHNNLPYHLLMLGGDDLLLITQPQYAFPFVIEYSKALKEHGVPYKENYNQPISIGAGVAIASCKVPFFMLYSLAEELADSAKKLYRSQQGNSDGQPEERSVVDWSIATTSWMEGMETNRRNHELRQHNKKQICTMAKPYFVLANDKETFSLETLWNEAEKVLDIFAQEQQDNSREQLARSQLKRMLPLVSSGDPEKSKEFYQQLPENIRDQLQNLFGREGKGLWRKQGEHRYLTQYKDFIELVELHYLGRQKKNSDQLS